MPPPRASLRSFLSSAKTILKNPSQQSSPVTFIIGNESADLDSLCSAVVLAYLRTYTSTSKSNHLYIPLSNLPRADLSLRPELLPVLSRANLKPSDLITLSELSSFAESSSEPPPGPTNWVLVDHNALEGDLGDLYGSRVVGCIDHHDEEGKVPKDCGDEPRIIKKSGSCSSLVVGYCREGWDSLSAESTESETASWNAELASLALAPILIDTTNLTSESKTTPADVEAARYLENLISAAGGDFSSDAYFEEVSKAKEDIGGLSLPDILRKDYKQWIEAGSVNLGISSVVKDLPFLIKKAGGEESFLTVVKDFAKERSLSIYSIMTTSHPNGVFQRELLVWGLDERGAKSTKKFEADAKEALGLVQWGEGALDQDGNGQFRQSWRQQRVENSRKQVAPLLRAAVLP